MFKDKLAGKIKLESNYLPPGEFENQIMSALKRQSIALPRGTIALPPVLLPNNSAAPMSLAEALKMAKLLKA